MICKKYGLTSHENSLNIYRLVMIANIMMNKIKITEKGFIIRINIFDILGNFF